MKITQNAHGTHVFKRNFSPALRAKHSIWNTNYSDHPNYRHSIEADLGQPIFKVMGDNLTLMREMLPPQGGVHDLAHLSVNCQQVANLKVKGGYHEKA